MKVKFISYLILIPLVVVIFVFLSDDEPADADWEEEMVESDYEYDYSDDYVTEEPYSYEEELYPETLDGEPIADFAEVEPHYPGGEEAMADFIRDNIVYPEYEREMGMQGTVYAQFVVAKTGDISNVKIVKDIEGSANFGPEVIRVIERMPAWVPGKQDGEKVNVRFTLPVNFRIQ